MRCSCRGERRGEEEGREGSGGAAEDGVELGKDLVPLLGRVRQVRDGAAGAERQVCSRRKREEVSCATEMEEETSGREDAPRPRLTRVRITTAQSLDPSMARKPKTPAGARDRQDGTAWDDGLERDGGRTRVGAARDVPFEVVEELQAAQLGRAGHRACRDDTGSGSRERKEESSKRETYLEGKPWPWPRTG